LVDDSGVIWYDWWLEKFTSKNLIEELDNPIPVKDDVIETCNMLSENIKLTLRNKKIDDILK